MKHDLRERHPLHPLEAPVLRPALAREEDAALTTPSFAAPAPLFSVNGYADEALATASVATLRKGVPRRLAQAGGPSPRDFAGSLQRASVSSYS